MKHNESNLQIAIVRYVRAKYPHSRIHHVANGGKREAKAGAILKREGVSAGFPDLLIYSNSSILHIELKTAKGRLSPAQKEWGDYLTAGGYDYAVAYGFDEAKEIIDSFVACPKK